MSEPDARPPSAPRTPWAADLAAPLRAFARAEAAGAVGLLAATVAALLWANLGGDSYHDFWGTELAFALGDWELTHDLHGWVTDGLIVFFFFLIGLELRRELDMGDLRERRRVGVPLLAGIGGMVFPALLYLAFNWGGEGARGWAIPVATDTAFALGALAVLGRRCPGRVRTFLLTAVIVDDVAAILIIAAAYTDHLSPTALAVAFLLFGAILALRYLRAWRGPAYLLLGFAAWVATFESGIHPTILGVAMGLLATAYPPPLPRLEHASAQLRRFREEPSPEAARATQLSVVHSISPNERLQHLFHPWTSHVVVPLFALANAGVVVDADTVGRALGSPITLGIVAGLAAGKPAGMLITTLVARRAGFPLTIPWPKLAGAATIAGIGFTVSLFIAQLSFEGDNLQEAKLGILAASVIAAALGWLVFVLTGLLPDRFLDAPDRTGEVLDLAVPVDVQRDHVRGPLDAPVTLVEYGDYECPYCGDAEELVRELLAAHDEELRYVFRHLPLTDVHPHARLAALAAEAAGAQGRFWELHDLLFAHQDALEAEDLARYAREAGLDERRFWHDVRTNEHAHRVQEDLRSAEESGVAGTPTFFVNGLRYRGAATRERLESAVGEALRASGIAEDSGSRSG